MRNSQKIWATKTLLYCLLKKQNFSPRTGKVSRSCREDTIPRHCPRPSPRPPAPLRPCPPVPYRAVWPPPRLAQTAWQCTRHSRRSFQSKKVYILFFNEPAINSGVIISSVSDPHWFQCGSGSQHLKFNADLDTDPDPEFLLTKKKLQLKKIIFFWSKA